MTPVIKAIHTLAKMGFKVWVEGDELCLRYEGQKSLDWGQVDVLVEMVKRHKQEALYFVKSYCPRCGGVVFIPDYEGVGRCLACERDYLTELYPGLKGRH
ncbi:MAG: hypothetical protein AB1491_02245 [Thermodesulfobacteriota bacterium]